MAEMLRLEEQYAIVSETDRSPAPFRVLKYGDSFAVFDPHGDVVPGPSSEPPAVAAQFHYQRGQHGLRR
jgi:hypothetical protein